MNPDWRGFLKAAGKKPKDLASAVLDHLNPPLYVRQILKRLNYLCEWCNDPRIDECSKCHASVCGNHAREIKDPRLAMEWRLCPHEPFLNAEDYELLVQDFAGQEADIKS